jgi:hypothetical protein
LACSVGANEVEAKVFATPPLRVQGGGAHRYQHGLSLAVHGILNTIENADSISVKTLNVTKQLNWRNLSITHLSTNFHIGSF